MPKTSFHSPRIPFFSHPLPALYQKITPIIYKNYSSLVMSSAFTCLCICIYMLFFQHRWDHTLCNFLQRTFLLNMAWGTFLYWFSSLFFTATYYSIVTLVDIITFLLWFCHFFLFQIVSRSRIREANILFVTYFIWTHFEIF